MSPHSVPPLVLVQLLPHTESLALTIIYLCGSSVNRAVFQHHRNTKDRHDVPQQLFSRHELSGPGQVP